MHGRFHVKVETLTLHYTVQDARHALLFLVVVLLVLGEIERDATKRLAVLSGFFLGLLRSVLSFCFVLFVCFPLAVPVFYQDDMSPPDEMKERRGRKRAHKGKK